MLQKRSNRPRPVAKTRDTVAFQGVLPLKTQSQDLSEVIEDK
jgi:hypothetical protein